jgi:Protein of unknown function (DUF3592)
MGTLFAHINWIYLLLSLVGVVAILSAARSMRQAGRSENWPGVQGRIIESRVDKRTEVDYDSPADRTNFIPVVRYTYSLQGKEYTGERVAFGVKNTNRNPAAEVVNRYPLDKLVMVYYNPEKPEEAVLERASGSGWLQIGIGVVLILAGIYYALK